MAQDMRGPIANSVPNSANLKIFISYSRRDMSFVDRLEAALKTKKIVPIIDRGEIYAFEDWWRRIETLIGQADTMLFVLSPESVGSEVCSKEIEYAISLGKRIAPIVFRHVDAIRVPQALARLNFIFFDDADRFEERFANLVEALSTDISWVRKHTEFGENARAWEVGGRPSELLLRSPTLEDAERWIASRPNGASDPTELTRSFIIASRRGATRRRNILTGSLASGLVVALSLAGLAFWERGVAKTNEMTAVKNETRAVANEKIAEEQRNIADKNRAEAEKQRDQALTTQSRFLADLANQRIGEQDDETALLLSLEALPDSDAADPIRRDRPYVSEAEAAMYNAFHGLRREKHLVRVFSGAAISPDGRYFAFAANSGKVQLWDSVGWKLLSEFDVEKAWRMRFSVNGEWLAIQTWNNSVVLHSASNTTITGRIPSSVIDTFAISPDGSRLLTGGSSPLKFWDPRSGAQIAAEKADVRLAAGMNILSIAFSADGRRAAVARQDRTAEVWDTATGSRLSVLTGHGQWVQKAVFDHDGKHVLTASGDCTARVWDSETGRQIAMLTGHSLPVSAAAFSPDGRKIATGSGDHTVRIWDAATGNPIAVFAGHSSLINDVEFSPDGKQLVSSSFDGTARVYDVERLQEIAVMRGHDGSVTAANFTSDGHHVLTVSMDSTIRSWDLASDNRPGVRIAPTFRTRAAVVSPDGKSIVTMQWDSNEARLWTAEDLTPRGALTGKGFISASAFSSDSRIVALAAGDGQLKLFSTIDGTPLSERQNHTKVINTVRFSNDGNFVVTAGADNIAVVSKVKDPGGTIVLKGHQAGLTDVEFDPTGRYAVTASLDNTVRVWDAKTGEQLLILLPTASAGVKGATRAEFISHGTRIASAWWDGEVRIFDAISGKELLVLDGREVSFISAVALASLAVSPDGRFIAGSFGKTPKVWNSDDGKRVSELKGHAFNTSYLQFSPDSNRIVTASDDGTSKVWDVRTGHLIASLAHGEPMSGATFFPFSDNVLTVSSSELRSWKYFPTTQSLVRAAKDSALRCLSMPQRDRAYLGPGAPQWCATSKKWPFDNRQDQ